MEVFEKYLKQLLFLIIVSIMALLNVNAATNPYPKTSTYGTNCTWYAWKMVNEKIGLNLPAWGNAKDWYNNAKNSGYEVGSTPKSNSIIVWGDWTAYGHVGYVESVNGTILNVWDSTGPCIDEEDLEYQNCMANGVSEESDKICKANAKRIACKYDSSLSEYAITGYIYLDKVPKKEVSTTKKTTFTTTSKKSNNANLSDIELSKGNIDFKKDNYEYLIEVDNNVDTIKINALAESNKASIYGNGNYELNVGLNEIKIIVTAEDNSNNEYVLKITRKEEKETVYDLKEDKEITDNNKSKIIILILSLVFLIFALLKFIPIKNANK